LLSYFFKERNMKKSPICVPIRVRYAETDRMGYVYYANYIAWFEIGRSALLRESGYPYSKLEKDGCILPVVEVYCKYRAPAGYDEELKIECWIEKLTRRDIVFSYHIFRDEVLLAEGYTRHIPVSPQGKRIMIPEVLFNCVAPYLRKK